MLTILRCSIIEKERIKCYGTQKANEQDKFHL
jgi:hypothetical protein